MQVTVAETERCSLGGNWITARRFLPAAICALPSLSKSVV